jgi:hypothetical protein
VLSQPAHATASNNRAPAPFALLTPSQPACELEGFGRRGGWTKEVWCEEGLW